MTPEETNTEVQSEVQKQPPYCPSEKEEAEVKNWFQYHSPKGDQAERYVLIREKANDLARILICNVPPSADRTASLRKLRECVMTANAAIACGE